MLKNKRIVYKGRLVNRGIVRDAGLSPLGTSSGLAERLSNTRSSTQPASRHPLFVGVFFFLKFFLSPPPPTPRNPTPPPPPPRAGGVFFLSKNFTHPRPPEKNFFLKKNPPGKPVAR